MGRFNSFNSQMSGFNDLKDPGFDDDKDEDDKEDDGLFASPADFEEPTNSTCEVELPASEEERQDNDYTNAAFWKPVVNEDELNDILEGYE